MNSPAFDMSTILAAASLGLTGGTNLFVGREPSAPDAAVTLSDTGGIEPQIGYVFLQPRVQARIRSAAMDYDDAYTLAESIRNTLHELTPQTIGGTKYISVLAISDIFSVGEDSSDRISFTINFQIQRGDV